MYGTSKACWQTFVDWLMGGAPGAAPATLSLTYGGPVWGLEAELLRLTRLMDAPPRLFFRPGWLAWETRYWALVVCLGRIGQHYAALAQRPNSEAGSRWQAAAEATWQRVTSAEAQVA